MSGADKLILVAVILQAAYALYQRMNRHRAGREVDAALAPGPDASRWQASAEQRLAAARAELATLETRASAARAELEAARDVALSQGIATRLLPTLARLASRLAGLAPESVDPASLQAVERQVVGLRRAVEAVQNEAQWRRRPGTRESLARAHTVATAMLAPLLRALPAARRAHLGRPLVMVLHVHEAWSTLLPDALVIGVPDELDADPLRWAEVGYGVANAITDAPEFVGEIGALMPGARVARLPAIQGNRLFFDLNACVAGWLPTLANDALLVVLLGPAGLRGIMSELAAPGSLSTLTIGTPDGQHVSHLPPPVLRVHALAWLLERMGLAREGAELRRAWDAQHGPVETMACPTLGGEQIGVMFAPFRVRAQQALEAIYTTPWTSLDGVALPAVPGLELTGSLWTRVRQRAVSLAAGEPVADDPRIVVAAAIEAAAAHPGTEPTIAAGVRRALAGRRADAGPSPATPRAPGDGRVTPADVRDAVALGALLSRRRWR